MKSLNSRFINKLIKNDNQPN